MRKLVVVLYLLTMCCAFAEFAFAGGSQWFALKRKAARIAEWQINQEQRFRAAEKRSLDLLKPIDSARQLIRREK